MTSRSTRAARVLRSIVKQCVRIAHRLAPNPFTSTLDHEEVQRHHIAAGAKAQGNVGMPAIRFVAGTHWGHLHMPKSQSGGPVDSGAPVPAARGRRARVGGLSVRAHAAHRPGAAPRLRRGMSIDL